MDCRDPAYRIIGSPACLEALMGTRIEVPEPRVAQNHIGTTAEHPDLLAHQARPFMVTWHALEMQHFTIPSGFSKNQHGSPA